MSTSRYGQFRGTITRARDLVGLGQSVVNITSGIVDGSDMYRYGLVQAVAGLDAYVHGVVLDRAVDVIVGRIEGEINDGKVSLGLSIIREIVSAKSAADAEMSARTYLAQRLSRETYQRPDSIAAGLAMVGVNKVWSRAFPADPATAKLELGLVVDRRNNIVHSCDFDPLIPGFALALTDQDALDAIATVERTVAAIDPLCLVP